MERIKGIDTIRFVCALIVVLGHFGFPKPDLVASASNPILFAINGFIDNAFNGPAAVIVFFIISGFCIHYPFVGCKSVPLYPYYSRRIIRICLPALIAMGVYSLVGLKLTVPHYGVFWSVICELIYYLLYPLLLQVRNKLSWGKLILPSFVVYFMVCFTNLDQIAAAQNNYIDLGALTWIIGLPCWLLGCWLAENYQLFSYTATSQIWILRAGIFFASVFLQVIKFHVHSPFASNIFTLNAFAFPVCWWLGLEIIYFKERIPSPILERAGRWSYSLYIIHQTIPAMITLLGVAWLQGAGLKIVQLVVALAVSYVFFLVVEKPSHKLAKYVSRAVRRSSTAAAPVRAVSNRVS
ncbi:acyltransferase family protein [Fibrella aquatilis]|uniref:Acyltransferase n=1 Tax=Fibrella aquatilis TaxID=2817059 RepID=A0A939G8J1_9BACT|nr:acyltransferase [Fibrella aquatilis]MBO0933193.1 acyltransferase [Fibrella aquatilis]